VVVTGGKRLPIVLGFAAVAEDGESETEQPPGLGSQSSLEGGLVESGCLGR
jgi:hypothetical protein